MLMVDPEHGAPEREAAQRPRGRRARGEDTREAIIEAARAEFLERGYVAGSMRAVARRAGVDPALVRYWFDDKPSLFAASLMDAQINPARLAERVAAGPLETIGTRLLETVLGVWEFPDAQEKMQLLLQSVAAGFDLPTSIREYLMTEVFSRVRPVVPGPDAGLRVNLAMSHVVGLLLARYVVRLEPLASAPVAEVVATAGPVIQRYFTPDAP